MTDQMDSGQGVDISQIAPQAGPAWKPDVGDKVAGTITYASTFEKSNYNETGFETSLRIDLQQDDGETITVYAVANTDSRNPQEGYAKANAKAISEAVRAAGPPLRLLVGGRLGMRRLEDQQTKFGDGHRFQAQYSHPVVPVATASKPQGVPTALAPAQPVEEDVVASDLI